MHSSRKQQSWSGPVSQGKRLGGTRAGQGWGMEESLGAADFPTCMVPLPVLCFKGLETSGEVIREGTIEAWWVSPSDEWRVGTGG